MLLTDFPDEPLKMALSERLPIAAASEKTAMEGAMLNAQLPMGPSVSLIGLHA